MSIERIELRKKYYDGNMVREAVMSVTDDYNTIMKLLLAFADQPPLTDVIEVVRCRNCRYFAIVNQPYDQTWCGVMQDSVKPDGYCYWGERREDDTD